MLQIPASQQACVKISGHVQGVFYRAHAQEKAKKLNLTGYAKNVPDGTVEVLLQGPKSQINIFIDWARQGSPSAKVERVDVQWQELTKKFTEFKIF